MNEAKQLLVNVVSGVYKDLILQELTLDTKNETYAMHFFHGPTKRDIKISLRDVNKRRDFDIIPIQTQNAPFSLIEIFRTFLEVFWYAIDNNIDVLESLTDLLNKENSVDKDKKEEKLVQ